MENDYIVLLKDEDVVRNQWRLGRITETIEDKDGLVRRVKIKIGDRNLKKDGKRISKESVLERPVHKVILILKNGEN